MAASNGEGRLNLYSLPNEVLVQILTPFSTRALLPLTAVSHRFLALVLRILHYRLLIAASLKDYKLMLECFHPSSKLTEPHVFCTYLGTPGLSDKYDGIGSLYEDTQVAERLGLLSSLYSRFRPIPRADEGNNNNGRRFFPTGTGTMVGIAGAGPEEELEVLEEKTPQFVRRSVHLESSEDFSQLCTVVNLVKVIPNSNLLLSAVTVEDGIIRIWRDWLEEQAQLGIINDAQRRIDAVANATREDSIPSDAGAGSRPLAGGRRREEESGILWVDTRKNVGLKFRVREKRWHRDMPVLMYRDEGPAVTYEVDIEELRIRTTRLLLTVEKSIQEQQNYSRAVVFGAVQPRGLM
ncbi:hypothetical protein VTN00DRAFT_15 [Thermoascus crustaceus]|uniref:uncharacterized protein n=1 Tax=Thermoascus crustaceus TaxID=5088 RepID=UPI0037421662